MNKILINSWDVIEQLPITPTQKEVVRFCVAMEMSENGLSQKIVFTSDEMECETVQEGIGFVVPKSADDDVVFTNHATTGESFPFAGSWIKEYSRNGSIKSIEDIVRYCHNQGITLKFVGADKTVAEQLGIDLTDAHAETAEDVTSESSESSESSEDVTSEETSKTSETAEDEEKLVSGGPVADESTTEDADEGTMEDTSEDVYKDTEGYTNFPITSVERFEEATDPLEKAVQDGCAFLVVTAVRDYEASSVIITDRPIKAEMIVNAVGLFAEEDVVFITLAPEYTEDATVIEDVITFEDAGVTNREFIEMCHSLQ